MQKELSHIFGALTLLSTTQCNVKHQNIKLCTHSVSSKHHSSAEHFILSTIQCDNASKLIDTDNLSCTSKPSTSKPHAKITVAHPWSTSTVVCHAVSYQTSNCHTEILKCACKPTSLKYRSSAEHFILSTIQWDNVQQDNRHWQSSLCEQTGKFKAACKKDCHRSLEH